jgi:hypothetical protein
VNPRRPQSLHFLLPSRISRTIGSSASAPLSKYYSYRTRICRPVGLAPEDCKTICNYALARIGCDYDLRNIIDLMRYLVPLPVPQRWRRRMIALGSGNPTRMICSALIAQAFEAVRYPILPRITVLESNAARRELLESRDSSLYAPRDFDVSPYFMVIKPTLAEAFDYKRMDWVDLPAQSPAPAHATSDIADAVFRAAESFTDSPVLLAIIRSAAAQAPGGQNQISRRSTPCRERNE